MMEWLGYLHFLWCQFAAGGKGGAFSFTQRHHCYQGVASLPSLRLVGSGGDNREKQGRGGGVSSGHPTRIYLHQPTTTRRAEEESDDVWGFRDTQYRINDQGTVEVTGDRYLLSGCKLPSFLPWANETLCVEVPLQPVVVERHGEEDVTATRGAVSEPHRGGSERFLEELRRQAAGLRDDQVSADVRVRRRHGHGHTQEEMYDLKYGAGLARIPDLVLYPETEAQVVALVAAAAGHDGGSGACLIPYGGGTNVTEALRCPPDDDGGAGDTRIVVSVDTRRMNRIIWIDPINGLAQIEAGAVGADIAAALAGHGFTLGHEPDSCEFSTLGGWIATNASGMKKNRYGNIEDIVLDMRVVTASGAVLTKGQSGGHGKGDDGGDDDESGDVHPRESTGSNPLRYVFGCEGTLGIVTSAVVKVSPLPEATSYAAVVFPSWEAGVQFLYELRASPSANWPASVRLVDNEQFRMSQALKPAPPAGLLRGALAAAKRSLEHFYVLTLRGFDPHRMVACTMVFEGTRDEVRAQQRAVKRLGARHGAVDAGADNGRRGYEMTYNIAYIRDFAMRHGILGESFETSVAWSALLDLCDRVKDRVRREHDARGLPGRPLVSCRVTQLYGAGVAVYFYYAYYFEGVAEPARVYAEVEAAAREEILSAGGSLSHHHGVGRLRRGFLSQAWSPAALEWRKEVKRAVDPGNVFGCGNLVP